MKAFLKNTPISTLIISCLILAGAVAIFFASKTNNAIAPIALKQTDADYILAVPSVGPLLDRRKVTLSSIDADTRTAKLELPVKDLGEIREKQRVLFFQKDLTVQHYTGTVKKIEVKGASNVISISIPDKIDLETLSLTADIFTLELRKVKRVPLTAISKEDDGRFYVWVATEESAPEEEAVAPTALDTTKPIISGAERLKNKKALDLHEDLIGKTIKRHVQKLYVAPGAHNNLLVDLGYNVNRREMIVMNPDENLTEGEKQSFLFKQIRAPSLLPHYEAALIEGRRIERQVLAELRQKAARCQAERKELIEKNNLSPEYYSNKKDVLGKQSLNYSEAESNDSSVNKDWEVLSILGLTESGTPTGSCGF